MIPVFLDTNFLMLPEQYRVDIFSEIERLILEEYRLVTSSSVRDELEGIVRSRDSKGKDKIAAKIALELLRKRDIKVIDSKDRADEFILNFSHENPQAIVCTNDRELKRKLKKRSIRVISMRGKSYLDYDY